MQHSIYLSFH